MRKVMISLMALVLSGAMATAMQAERPVRPAQRPAMGMQKGQRPGKGGAMMMPGQGKGKPGQGMAGANGPRKGKAQRPGGGQRPAGGGMGRMVQR